MFVLVATLTGCHMGESVANGMPAPAPAEASVLVAEVTPPATVGPVAPPVQHPAPVLVSVPQGPREGGVRWEGVAGVERIEELEDGEFVIRNPNTVGQR